jgi:K+-transporting ATPase KdpF subunit
MPTRNALSALRAWHQRVGVGPHERGKMSLDYVVGLIVTVGLLVYLTYALLRPEKF